MSLHPSDHLPASRGPGSASDADTAGVELREPQYDDRRYAERYRAAIVRGQLREPGTTREQLTEALADHNPMVRRAALTHPQCPLEVLLTALQDPDPQVRAEVVRTVSHAADLPATVTEDVHWAVRSALVKRPDCPVTTVMDLLVGDPDPQVRRDALTAGAGRRDVVWELVRRHPGVLTTAVQEYAREELAQLPAIDSALLLWLAFHDPSPDVRAAAIRHPRLSTGLLPRAFRDPCPQPRVEAVRRPGFPSHLLRAASEDEADGVRLATLTHHPLVPPIPERLSRDADSFVRAQACAHRNCPADALERAVEDPVTEVRRAAVGNPSMPRRALASACRDNDPEVQLSALRHPCAPPASASFAAYRRYRPVLAVGVNADDEDAVARRRHAERMTESAAGALVRAPWDELRPLPLTRLPHELINRVISEHLDDAARDHRVTIRLVTARHPAVQARHLVELSKDADPGVRAAASSRLLEIL